MIEKQAFLLSTDCVAFASKKCSICSLYCVVPFVSTSVKLSDVLRWTGTTFIGFGGHTYA